ncbi:hypothetical protein GCM10022223_17730 [Kineosporia mesophila]|uniref:Uncharacterized protein n=1 Tax=Kineosporia mesophila TaxID=566012 RepID=A0ABP6ZBE0_9ACTN
MFGRVIFRRCTESRFTGGVVDWNTEEVGKLVSHLRRQGIPVHQASVTQENCLAVQFEPHLAQAEILEGLLLSWPGIVAVERVEARVMYAYGSGNVQAIRRFRDGRRTSPSWWRWFR